MFGISGTLSIRLVLVVIMLLITPWFLGGCEPKVASPISGRPVTEAQLLAEYARTQEETRLADERDAAAAKAAVAQAESEARLAAQKLDAESAIAAAEIRAELERKTAGAVSSYEAASAARASTLQGITDQVELAQGDIARQRQVASGLWGIAKPFIATAPGGTAAIGAVEMLLGAGFLGTGTAAVGTGVAAVRAKRRAKQKEEEAARLDAAARSIVNGIDVLRAKHPEVASAMKAAKADILGQLTDHAVELIKSETIT